MSTCSVPWKFLNSDSDFFGHPRPIGPLIESYQVLFLSLTTFCRCLPPFAFQNFHILHLKLHDVMINETRREQQ